MFNSRSTVRERVSPPTGEESMTKQSHSDETDINLIMAKFQKTGLINHVKEGGRYEDLPSDLDYHTSMNLILRAQESFERLPSSIRAEFANDPERFLSFVENPDNVDRMAELGLINPPPAAQGKKEGEQEPAKPDDASKPVDKPE